MATIKQIAARLKEQHPDGISVRSKAEFEAVVAETWEHTEDILAGLVGTKGSLITPAGRFSIQHASARLAKNPRTKEPIVVPAKERPKFVPGRRLKDKLQAALDRRGDQHAGE
jgi:nucleoid DNA-binding protein